MRCIIRKTIVCVTILMSMELQASAQDRTTCSGLRAYCLGGVTARRGDVLFCENAFRTCMETGVWKTTGKYGRTVSQAIKR
jgi:hypothetical protein